MYGRFYPGVLFGVLAIVLIAGIGGYAYKMGLAQGVAQGTAAGAAVGSYFWHPRPFHPFFGVFGCLIPLFFILLFGGLARMMFWRGPMMGHGGWRGRWGEDGVPPMFEEWHKRSHAKPEAADPTEPKPEGKPGK